MKPMCLHDHVLFITKTINQTSGNKWYKCGRDAYIRGKGS